MVEDALSFNEKKWNYFVMHLIFLLLIYKWIVSLGRSVNNNEIAIC